MKTRPLRVVLLTLIVLATGAVFGAARAEALGFAAHVDYTVGAYPYSVAVGDFDDDGDADLVSANQNAGTVSVLLGAGDGTFASKVDYGVGSAPSSVAVGDFDGDGDADLVSANWYANTVSVLLGAGDGTFAPKVDYGVGSAPSSVAVGDFDGDGKQDLVSANYSSGTVSVLLGAGDGTFASKVDYGVGYHPCSVAVGDFDGDGDADLVSANWYANTVSVLLGAGDGTFASKVDYGVGSAPSSVAVGDLDGNGKQDLVSANYSSGTVSVLLGAGDGTFASKVDYGVGSAPSSVAVGDFDGNGDADLVSANYGANTVSVLLGAGDGTFASKVDYGVGSAPSSVAVGDLDGNGKQDLVSANSGAGTLSVLLGTWATPSGTMTIAGGGASTNGCLVRVDSKVSDAAQMRLRNAGGAWSAWQNYGQHTYWTLPSGDGEKTVEAQYRSSVGSVALSDAILLDTTAPVTIDDAPSGWQTSPVTVTLTGDDGTGSGVAETEYKLDDDSSWTSGTSVTVTGDGAHTIRYRSVDEAGNVGDIESCAVKLDSVAPVTTAYGADAAWHRWPVSLALSGSDATSGVATTEYSTDGGSTWTSGTFLAVSAEGETTVAYRSTDAAGNVEAAKTVTVRVDTVAPTTSGAKLTARKNKKVAFSVKVADPTPCCADGASVTIKVKNAKGKVVKTLSFANVTVNAKVSLTWAKCSLKKGTHSYAVYATDAAGNAQKKAGGSTLIVK